jgi:hypothetical protein
LLIVAVRFFRQQLQQYFVKILWWLAQLLLLDQHAIVQSLLAQDVHVCLHPLEQHVLRLAE